MNNRRKLIAALGAGALAAPLGAFSQQSGKVWRIGFLAVRSKSTPSNPDVYYDSFVKGMRNLGYVEGKNLTIEWRAAEGKYERFPELAAELVRMKVEIIVTHGPATRYAQQATKTIPIVMAGTNDPVASGIVKSLARPEGNVTGLSLAAIDVSPKQLELLKIMLQKLSHVAVLVNPVNPATPGFMKSVQEAGKQIGIAILPVEAGTPDELERGFAAMARERADAVIVTSDESFTGQRRLIPKLALKGSIASIFSNREYVEAGGLMGYGQNLAEVYYHTASYVDKILKGAKPGELPIEQPTKFHLAINRKTANALGLTIPQELLLRADEVIE